MARHKYGGQPRACLMPLFMPSYRFVSILISIFMSKIVSSTWRLPDADPGGQPGTLQLNPHTCLNIGFLESEF